MICWWANHTQSKLCKSNLVSHPQIDGWELMHQRGPKTASKNIIFLQKKPRYYVATTPSLSCTQRRTARRLWASIQLLLHLFSFSSLFPTSSLATSDPSLEPMPQSFQSVMTAPQHDQISSHTTSKRICQSGGKGICFSRVVRRIAAHANVFGGCMVYKDVKSLFVSTRHDCLPVK